VEGFYSSIAFPDSTNSRNRVMEQFEMIAENLPKFVEQALVRISLNKINYHRGSNACCYRRFHGLTLYYETSLPMKRLAT
jgi:hypothetical protein